MLPEYIPQGLEDGRTRDLMHLTSHDFEIRGIASRLAKINRFCGATRFPLSVATHSVVVSYLCPEQYALTGLLHDISESFAIGDMIRPIKAINPAFKELELEIERQLCAPFPCLHDIAKIKQADNRATAIEAFVHRGSFPDWASLDGFDWRPTPYEQDLINEYYRHEIGWQLSATMFLDRYAELTVG